MASDERIFRGEIRLYQQVIVTGRLGKDVNVHETKAGGTIYNFPVAASDSYKDKEGNWVDSTEWFKCTRFVKNPGNQINYLYKGALVTVVGKMKTRQWETDEGEKKYSTELIVDKFIFLSKPKDQAEEEVPNLDDVPF
jgi:single-strand DNA-binding protein